MEALKKTKQSDFELREEAYQDAIMEEDENFLDYELRESHSKIERRTQEIGERQDTLNSRHESQYFTDLETASSSRSMHAPSKPFIFRVFSQLLWPRLMPFCRTGFWKSARKCF